MNENLEKEIVELKDIIIKHIVKPQKKAFLVCTILFFVYGAICLFGGLGIFAAFVGYESLTEDDTIQLTATISKIQPMPFYYIQVEEFNATFEVLAADMVEDMDALAALSVGQSIIFRISKSDVSKTDEITATINFVSLKFGAKEIITLNSYNESNNIGSAGAAIALFVMGGLFVALGVGFFVAYKRKNISTLKKEESKNLDVF